MLQKTCSIVHLSNICLIFYGQKFRKILLIINFFFSVDDRHRLLENEDTSGSGYLTIPLSISRLFPSVLQHYDSLLTNESSLVSSIQLPPTDAIFVEKFGSPLPENVLNRNDIWYEYSPPETVLYVSVGKNEAHSFSIGETKTKDIVDYINVAKEKKCSFTVSYNIQVLLNANFLLEPSHQHLALFFSG